MTKVDHPTGKSFGISRNRGYTSMRFNVLDDDIDIYQLYNAYTIQINYNPYECIDIR